MVETNPVVGTNKVIDEVSRDRVLTPEELRLLWARSGPGDYGAILRLLILTGQRRKEAGGMMRSEIDVSSKAWNIPASRTKNNRAYEVPLSDAAMAVVGALFVRHDRDLLFGAGARFVSGVVKEQEGS